MFQLAVHFLRKRGGDNPLNKRTDLHRCWGSFSQSSNLRDCRSNLKNNQSALKEACFFLLAILNKNLLHL